jgi:hypothetical protein
MVIVRGRLTPELGAVLKRALDAAREVLYGSAEAPTAQQQQADALGLLAEAALHQELDPGAPGQSLLEDGVRVSAETSQRLACDASRVVMRHDPEGQVIEVGARTRTIPPAIRRALHHRDRGCRFPGCTVRFGQGHQHWAHGGPTTLSNLTMLCRRHHRAVHEEGYQVERRADGELRFRRPNGDVLPQVPVPMTVPGQPSEVVRAQNRAHGIRIDARTSMPLDGGARLNLAYAIDVLHPRANPAAV